jgi:23S rRNA U2552 (ribose-2'-O)-methylase RlmE/FtsJ
MLASYLGEIKERLNHQEREWNVYKKYTNPYEYIHTVVPMKKRSVSLYNPLSRSYYKMIEMIHVFKLLSNDEHVPMNTFHLAEGPGGFIEAFVNTRRNLRDSYVGMTLIDNANPDIPSWKKSDHFLRNHPNVCIETGADHTGNILSADNLDYCRRQYGSTMDVITADGGFDFSQDFNNQEVHIVKLLFAQVCFALAMQKPGGSFVLKIFDCFMEPTIDIVYLLSSLYDKVYVYKPFTSRYGNSERYIVCKGFCPPATGVSSRPTTPVRILKRDMALSDMAVSKSDAVVDLYSRLHATLVRVIDPAVPPFLHRILSVPISIHFINKLEEYNAILGQQQIENIHYTISLMEHTYKQEKIETIIRNNIQKCICWCIKHDVEYVNLLPTASMSTNMFRDVGAPRTPTYHTTLVLPDSTP